MMIHKTFKNDKFNLLIKVSFLFLDIKDFLDFICS